MKLTVSGKNIAITEAIRDHLEERIDKDLHGLQDHEDTHVVLGTEKHRHFAEITIKAKGFSVHSKEETDDLYKAIDQVMLKVRKQLQKHKEKKRSQKERAAKPREE